MATSPTPAPETQTPINHIGRIFGALFNPKETFADIVRRPSWIAPIVLLTIFSLAITLIFTQRVGWERFMAQQFEQNPRTAQMRPEQRQQAMERAVAFAKVGGYVGSVIGNLVLALIVAAILMGAFNILAGAGVRFSTAMGVVSHGLMPLAVAGVLGILILYLKDPDTVNLQNLVGSNLGPLLGSDAPRWLTRLATSLDLFSFWSIFLMALGFSVANPKKVSLGKALGVVIGLWAVWVLVKVGWAAF